MATLSFISGALEGIGITAIIPLFSFIGGGGKASDNISIAIAKFFEYLHLPYTAKFLLIFMIGLFLAKALFLLFSQQISARVIADFEKKTRASLIKCTFDATWPFLSSQKVGHLDQMLSTEVANSSAILLYISNATLVVINLFIYSMLVFNISPTIAVLTVLSGATIFLIFLPFLQKTRVLSEKMVRENKELAHFASEHLIGAKTIKSMHLEGPTFVRGQALIERMRHLYLKLSFLKNSTAALLQLAGVFFVVGLFVFLYKTSAFEFASFAVVVYALNKVFTNIQFAQSSAHAISMQIPYLSSLLSYEKEARGYEEIEGGDEAFSFTKELSFRDVEFEYRKDDPALRKISFSIKKGEVIGLVGPSGAGKTTIVDLLLRLIEPTAGAILLDGRNIRSVSLKEWRKSIGYVSQEVFLLNDTIENNIRFYGDSVTNEDVHEAARMANIYDFIMSLPEKWQTVVGERGVLLSGGQRQRIMLARVLARKSEILLLDEATSALDTESEMLIQKAIMGLKGKVTVLAIAHRLSTVRVSDKLMVLQDGQIVEEGTPSALLQDERSRFFKMYHTHT
ncbi:MAG: hypothetical protein A2849_01280 [Candidatus Taylorbacteria bacterium RIFCSPHIGHO2_01_FULL_51_15]|uniref:ABC transporter ATP-binding protein n=1 Tax=Candidatus Taylorbacteria bacterium RIFCSPHIGHO2_01_FULL_51_15 TaxID=1802304 RepID=A0A1G2MBH1_9BACT|nr:MAG: hypothetical protein A2849_01280 [Candidatus Taylorbacteria bacterium RIFCSPHIGHO2_01_FULL_51_15]